MHVIEITIYGERHKISDEQIVKVARKNPPERIDKYAAAIEGKQFPPTQLIRLATEAPRVHARNSRRALEKLGFEVQCQR